MAQEHWIRQSCILPPCTKNSTASPHSTSENAMSDEASAPDVATAVQVIAISVAVACLAEFLNWLFLYRTSSYNSCLKVIISSNKKRAAPPSSAVDVGLSRVRA